ncbi:MAG: hypothetical protein A3F92_10920 [Candidatus Rokubacteria bacterium RIFCSPLOWO2_12_FULL_71_22]|nr:MAG: hypothetical protein A3F92_10920 [Candidatus Rokubacteria bacterium RIFCSPLOWO2_12_FULL_71_22]
MDAQVLRDHMEELPRNHTFFGFNAGRTRLGSITHRHYWPPFLAPRVDYHSLVYQRISHQFVDQSIESHSWSESVHAAQAKRHRMELRSRQCAEREFGLVLRPRIHGCGSNRTLFIEQSIAGIVGGHSLEHRARRREQVPPSSYALAYLGKANRPAHIHLNSAGRVGLCYSSAGHPAHIDHGFYANHVRIIDSQHISHDKVYPFTHVSEPVWIVGTAVVHAYRMTP